MTARPARALRGFRPAAGDEGAISVAVFGTAKIFKKTPCVADLKPGGRDVAKDMPEVAAIPFLTTRLLDPDLKLSGAELAGRKTKWKPRATNHTTGALWNYPQQAGPAVDVTVSHPVGAHEKQCYADI